VADFMDRVIPVVDETIRVLANTNFVEDPIAGVNYSRATSIVGSAYKRHGRILEDACRHSALPCGDGIRTIQVDMVAFDNADRTIRAYEIKRGNGQFDAGKIRSLRRDLLCIQVLLKRYGQVANVNPAAAESRIIFYYGVRSIPRPWSLVREELDEHFGFPIVAMVEKANDYFRTRLHTLLDAA
jgi:hypothetical protein